MGRPIVMGVSYSHSRTQRRLDSSRSRMSDEALQAMISRSATARANNTNPQTGRSDISRRLESRKTGKMASTFAAQEADQERSTSPGTKRANPKSARFVDKTKQQHGPSADMVRHGPSSDMESGQQAEAARVARAKAEEEAAAARAGKIQAMEEAKRIAAEEARAAKVEEEAARQRQAEAAAATKLAAQKVAAEKAAAAKAAADKAAAEEAAAAKQSAEHAASEKAKAAAAKVASDAAAAEAAAAAAAAQAVLDEKAAEMAQAERLLKLLPRLLKENQVDQACVVI